MLAVFQSTMVPLSLSYRSKTPDIVYPFGARAVSLTSCVCASVDSLSWMILCTAVPKMLHTRSEASVLISAS